MADDYDSLFSDYGNPMNQVSENPRQSQVVASPQAIQHQQWQNLTTANVPMLDTHESRERVAQLPKTLGRYGGPQDVPIEVGVTLWRHGEARSLNGQIFEQSHRPKGEPVFSNFTGLPIPEQAYPSDAALQNSVDFVGFSKNVQMAGPDASRNSGEIAVAFQGGLSTPFNGKNTIFAGQPVIASLPRRDDARRAADIAAAKYRQKGNKNGIPLLSGLDGSSVLETLADGAEHYFAVAKTKPFARDTMLLASDLSAFEHHEQIFLRTMEEKITDGLTVVATLVSAGILKLNLDDTPAQASLDLIRGFNLNALRKADYSPGAILGEIVKEETPNRYVQNRTAKQNAISTLAAMLGCFQKDGVPFMGNLKHALVQALFGGLLENQKWNTEREDSMVFFFGNFDYENYPPSARTKKLTIQQINSVKSSLYTHASWLLLIENRVIGQAVHSANPGEVLDLIVH